MSTTPLRGLSRRFGALTAALALSGGLFAPAAFADTTTTTTTAPTSTTTTVPSKTSSSPQPAPAPAKVPLKATISVEAGPYLLAEEVPVKLTITNPGTSAANGVEAWDERVSGSDFSISPTSWEGLVAPGTMNNPAVNLDAGATRVFNLKGKVYTWDKAAPRIKIHVSVPSDPNLSTSTGELAIPMVDPTTTKGAVGGIVFGDKNGNGTFDDGEGLAGVAVSLGGGGLDPLKTITDANGRFSFGTVSAQKYWLSVHDLPGGWVVPQQPDVAVDGSDKTANLRVRAVRPDSDQLHVTGRFDKDSYRPGDTAHVKITLSNSGANAISGIKAGCNRSGEGPGLVTGEWPEFAWNSPGVTINAGETKTFDETGTVPPNAADYGTVRLSCDFGPDSTPQDGHPTFDITAKVPGKIADTWGQIYYDRNDNHTIDKGEAITGTKVGLVDTNTGKVVAKAVTDENGRVDFKAIAAGLYEVRVFGTWAPADKWHSIYVGTCGFYCNGGWAMRFKPGPDQQDTDTVTPAPPAGEPVKPVINATVHTPADNGDLASTGASVIGLSLGGLAVLAIGIGAVLFTRRRRTNS